MRAKSTAAFQAITASRPIRWMAKQQSVCLIARILLRVWYLFTGYLWWPVKRLVRRVRKSLGRHEVWYYFATWVICALLGFVILQDFVYLKLLGGALVVTAFMFISIRSPIAGILFWLLTSPVINSIIRFKLIEGTPIITGDRVCISILLIVYLLQKKSKTEGKPSFLLHLSMAAFVGATLLATIQSDNPKWAAQEVLDSYFAPILMYLFARRWITNTRSLTLVLIAMVCVGAYFSAFAIPEHFTSRSLFTYGGRLAWTEEELGTVRVQGPAESPGEFGLIAAATMMLAITFFSHESAWRKRFLYALVVCMTLVGIGLTLRRSVYAGGLIGLLVLMFMASKHTRRTVFILLTVVTLAAIVRWGALSGSSLYTERLADMNPIYSRAIVQTTAWNIVKHHPVFGVGAGNFTSAKDKYLVPYKGVSVSYAKGLRSPHSSYLNILVEGGIIALLPFLSMLLMIFITSYHAYKRVPEEEVRNRDAIVVFWGLSLALIAQAASTDSFYFSRYLVSFWLFYFGAIAGTYLHGKKTTDAFSEKSAEKRAFT